MNNMNQIPVPTKTAERLRSLIEQRNRLNETIETIVATAADALAVPDGYVLRNLDVGWEAPTEQPQPTA